MFQGSSIPAYRSFSQLQPLVTLVIMLLVNGWVLVITEVHNYNTRDPCDDVARERVVACDYIFVCVRIIKKVKFEILFGPV